MSGLYDRLQAQLDDDRSEEKPAGLTPLDIADLPETQRRVMFVILRDASASTEGITLPALHQKLADVADLDRILDELARQYWLIKLGEPSSERYKVNLRRRKSSLQQDLWATLTDRLSTSIDQSDDREDPGRTPGLPAMSDW